MRGDTSPTGSSTITSLFMNQEQYEPDHNELYCRTLSSYKARYKDRLYQSASKVLEDYIHNYDKRQTAKLAKSMTQLCTKTPIKRATLQREEPSTLEKEIQMAKVLLPERGHSELSCDTLSSITTDDLLLAAPNYQILTADSQKLELPASSQNRISKRRFVKDVPLPSRTRINHPDHHERKVLSQSSSDESSTGTDWSTTTCSTGSKLRAQRKRQSRLCRALLFSSDEDLTQEPTTSSSCSILPPLHISTNPSSTFLPTSTADESLYHSVKEQAEDVQKTWRLVDDLKADLTHTETAINGRPRPSRESLVDLIERLSVAAQRKEERLRETVNESLHRSMHYSDLASRRLSSSTCTRTSGEDRTLDGLHVQPASKTSSLSDIPRAAVQFKPYTIQSSSSESLIKSVPASPVKRLVQTTTHEPAAWHRVSYNFPSTMHNESSSTATTYNVPEVIKLIDDRQINNRIINELRRSDLDIRVPHRVDFRSPPKANLNSTECRVETDPSTESFWKAEIGSSPSHVTLDAGRTPYLAHRKLSDENSISTDRLLDGDRTWERMPARRRCDSDTTSHISVSFQLEGKPTAVKGFMEDCLNAGEGPSLSGGKQPGSVETLKNMIFTLQGLTSSTSLPLEEDSQQDVTARNEMAGDQSLRRALVHLQNLKEIVEK